MLTIKEICDRTGININTFHAWRRADWRLLPDPIGVAKKTIYFDDSIIERIKFIKFQRICGKSLLEIQAMLEQQKLSDVENSNASGQNEGRTRTNSLEEFAGKWDNKNCKNEVCLALKLDPVLSSWPTVLIDPLRLIEDKWPLWIYVSIISNNYVHYAELYINMGEEQVEVKKHEKILVEHYGLFAAPIIQKYAEHYEYAPMEVVPYLLLSGCDDTYLTAKETVEFFKEAKKLARIIRAGKAFIKNL